MTSISDLHDAAYYTWRDGGVRGAVLVHIDAHHDAAADPDWQAIDIGNFVRAAIRHGLVGSVHWVVPEPMWDDGTTRRILLRELGTIGADVVATDREARARVDGAQMWLGPLQFLPRFDHPVLLDIDVDYLLTARYEECRSAAPLAEPWCTPRELVTRIHRAGLVASLTTIAMSVTGNFTPLEWAHLADDIAACLEGREQPRHEAALLFRQSRALLTTDRIEEARVAYRRACAIDRFYAHPFRSRGPYLLRRAQFEAAEAEYRNALLLAPDDPYALLGLALAALGRERWADARELARQVVAAEPTALDAWRALGAATAQMGDVAAAIEAYERALVLGLRGAAPLGGPWSSNPERRLVDPRHWDDHAALARLHESAGSASAAAAHRRMAAAGAAVLPS